MADWLEMRRMVSHLHDSDVVGFVDLRVFLQLFAQRGHGTFQVLLLPTELLLDVCVHAGRLRLWTTRGSIIFPTFAHPRGNNLLLSFFREKSHYTILLVVVVGIKALFWQ